MCFVLNFLHFAAQRVHINSMVPSHFSSSYIDVMINELRLNLVWDFEDNLPLRIRKIPEETICKVLSKKKQVEM